MDENTEPLVGMEAYFDSRSAEYEGFHLSRMDGGLEGKRQAVLALPQSVTTVLDLGIGTGLELQFLWKRFPTAFVTGVDISEKMMEQLKGTYQNAPIQLHHMDYFAFDYPPQAFDAVLSIASLHHFSQKEKRALYPKLFDTLRIGGAFVLCDCFSLSQNEEDEREQQLQDARTKQSCVSQLVHFDRPLFYENEIAIIREAGFQKVECVWQEGTTIILRAMKERENLK